MGESELVRDVLVVDDEPDIRLLLRALLEDEPSLQVVAEAGSADEAVAAMTNTAIDVVILDDQLGGGRSGTEVAPELKELRPRSVIVLYSAVTHPLTRPPGIDACIWKFESELLIPTVRLLLDEPAEDAATL